MPLIQTFTSPPPEELDDPWTVEIEGTYAKRHPKAGQTWSETFTLIPEMPAGLEALWLQTAVPTGRSTDYKTGAVINYLSLLFDQQVDKSHTRFLTLVNDPDRLVRKELLIEVMHAAVKALTGRPTGPASSSHAGQPETETGSTPESPQQDETPEPSTSENS